MARTVSVRLSADVSGYVAGMRQASAATKGLAAQGGSYIRRNTADINELATTAGLLGGALAVGVGLAVKTFADFDQKMSNVAATGQDAKNSMDALREAAIDAGAKTAFSASEAAEGVEQLAKAGLSAKDILAGGLVGALDLAAAGEVSVADAAEIAATSVTQFGLKGEDVTHVADLLAAGAGKAQGGVAELAGAMEYAGKPAASLGVSIEETTGTLALFAANGLLGQKAGTTFRAMLASLTNPSKKASAAMEDLGLSVFDANGDFIGMSNVAEQLNSKLGNLDDAQRSAALGTIFGNEAMQGSIVLMEAGKKGVDKWTAAVDEQGYAAQAASDRLDNLKGDFEEFTGSLETALIGMGEGADGPLRQLTQGATELVNKFSDLPGPVKQGALAVAAIGASALLGFAGIAKLATSAIATKDALGRLGVTAGGVKGKLQSINRGALLAGAGLIAVKLAAAALEAQVEKNSAGIDGYAQSLIGIGTSTEKLDADFAKFGDSFALFGQGVDSTSAAFELLNKSQNPVAEGFTAIGNAIGIDSTLATLTNEFTKLDSALVKMRPEDSAEAFSKLSKEASNAGFSMEEQLEIFSGYRDKLTDQATALGVNLNKQEQYQLMMGKVPPVLRLAIDAADKGAQSQIKLGDATQIAANEAAQAEQAFNDQANAMLQASGSAIGFKSAVYEATVAARKNGETLKSNTVAGRENRLALDNVASSALSYRDSLVQAGASTNELTKANANGLNEFIRVAEQMGYSRKRAVGLANDYGLLTPALKKAILASDKSASSQKLLAAASRSAADEAADAEKAIRDQANAMLAASGSAIGLEAAIDDATASVKENGKKLDINTKAGRANRTALDQVASAALTNRDAMEEAGASTKEVTKATKLSRGEFVRIAEKMGFTRKRAKELATEYGLVPKKVPTTVSSPGMDKTRREVRGLDKDINNVNSKKVTVGISWKSMSQKNFLKNAQANLGYSIGKSEGGPVWGEGTATSDSIPARLSNGEFVIKSRAARKIGHHRLAYANETGEMPGFASGGLVDLTVAGLTHGLRPDPQRDFNAVTSAVATGMGFAMSKALEKAIPKGTASRLGSDSATSLRGHRFTENFANRLRAVERALGTTLQITQGGFRPTTSYSGTSHAGDAVDIAQPFSSRTWKTMRKFGIAAWDRTGMGNWISHIHGVPLPGAGKAAGSAVWQAQDYKRGGNGLANGGLVTGPGGPRDDAISTRLSNGEYVVNAESTRSNLAQLNKINYGGNGGAVDMSQVLVALDKIASQRGSTINFSGPMGADPDKVANKIIQKQRDANIMIGVR